MPQGGEFGFVLASYALTLGAVGDGLAAFVEGSPPNPPAWSGGRKDCPGSAG